MATDACQCFCDCKGCGKRLKPLAGYRSFSALTDQRRARRLRRARKRDRAVEKRRQAWNDTPGGVGIDRRSLPLNDDSFA
jgi:hypothetical protein